VLDLIKRFAVSFAGSLLGFGVVSWALAAYLIGAFQQTVDTNSTSQNGRMDGIQQQLNLIQTQQNAFSETLRAVESGVSEMKTAQSEFVSKGLYRIDALAASTDYLISQAERVLSNVEPSPPASLGIVSPETDLLLTTGSSGRFVATFETTQEAIMAVSIEPTTLGTLVPYLFEVKLFSRDEDYIYQFSRPSSSVTIGNGAARTAVSVVAPRAGSYVIIVDSVPDVSFRLESLPLKEEQ
jgi:hypothetical protein